MSWSNSRTNAETFVIELPHLYVIPEEDGRQHGRRPDEGQSDELPQFFRQLGQQDLYRLPQVRHDEKPRRKVALLKAHAGAAEHHPFHRRRVHRRHPISHKPAVAHPHEAESPNAGGLHGRHDALGLVWFGPVGTGRGRDAEEEKIGDVEVESGSEEGA